MSNVYLGVNIDHVATLRNARGTNYPDPVFAASIAEQAGADGITTHLREDRRHINDRDVRILRETIKTRMNLEMAVTNEMVNIAVGLAPEFVCMVPENRKEITTFSCYFFSIFRNHAYKFRCQTNGNINHLISHSHFQVHSSFYCFSKNSNIPIVNMSSILAEMSSNTICSSLFSY